jgi:hypothetical protein
MINMLHLAYKSVSKEGTMRKVLVITIATAALFGATITADAQYNHRRNHGGGHYHGGGGNWVAPLVGGLLLGGAIYGLSQPSYAAPPAYRTECQVVPVYDRYGYYRGERRECYQVPNY